jgi:DNA primase
VHVLARIAPRFGFAEVRQAALALAREVERRAPALATSKWWKEERHGVFVDYNQNAKDRTVASAYSVRPRPDARVSTPVTWEELPDCDPADFTLRTVPKRVAEKGDPALLLDRATGSLEGLLELATRQRAEGMGDAPWPPHYARGEEEPPRAPPSRRRVSP